MVRKNINPNSSGSENRIPPEIQKVLGAIRFSDDTSGLINERDLPESLESLLTKIQNKYTSINYSGMSKEDIQHLANECADDLNDLLKGFREEPVFVSPVNRYRAQGVAISNQEVDRSSLYNDQVLKKSSSPIKEFDLTDDEIRQLLSDRGLHTAKGVRYKFGKQTHKFVGLVASCMYNSSAPNTEFGQGFRKSQEIFSPVTFVITDAVLMGAHKTMEKGMANRINKLLESIKCSEK